MSTGNFKIAVVSNNGSRVSQHFGSARFYEVFTIDNGIISNRERREKANFHTPGQPYNQHLHQHQHSGIKSLPTENNSGQSIRKGQGAGMGQGTGMQHGEGMGHGWDNHSVDKHTAMIGNIMDCKYLLSRGMGNGIYYHLQNAGIEPVVTDIQFIEDAIKAVTDGTIVNHSEKLH